MTGFISVDTLLLNIDVNAKKAQQQLKTFDQIMDNINKNINKTTRSVDSLKGSIMSFGFAALFGGMALKAFSTKVLTSLVTSFTKARDEGDFLANKVMGVSAAFEFLKFSIFDAFANSDFFIPIIDGIINMTNSISQFIAKNPQLAAMIVVFAGIGVVVGSLLMLIGQLALGFLGIVGLMEIVGSATAGVTVSVSAIASTLFTVAAAVAYLWFAWQTNMGNIQTFVKETWGIIWNTISSVIGDLMGIFEGLFLIIEGLFTGDFEKLWIGVVTIVANAISGIVKIVVGLGAAIQNIFIFVINFIKDAMFNMVDLAIGAGRALVSAFNKIPGVNISMAGFDKAEELQNKLRSALSIPESAFAQSEEVQNTYNAINDLKESVIDALTQRDELATQKETTVNINVEGSIIGEEEMVTRVVKQWQDYSLGSPNGG